jgi:hypothetical protein
MKKFREGESLIEICNKRDFNKNVKDSVFKTYEFTFKECEEFMEFHNIELLSDEVVEFWINQYSFTDRDRVLMYSSDYENLMGRVYKEYCQIIMNKLVDTGYLSLLWDNKKKIVFWKKIKV